MALTADILKANPVLASLTPEQLTTITVLSSNDETTVIGARIGELHGRYDEDVKAVTGIEKAQGEKSYDYVKRVLGTYKTSVEGVEPIKTELAQLKTLKADLEAQLLSKGSDAAVKQKLLDTETRLSQLQNTYTTEKDQFTRTISDLQGQVKMTKVESEFDKALAEFKFKPSLPDSIKNVLISNAKTQLMQAYTPDFIDEDGKQKLVFRDKTGIIANNPENVLKPFTAGEMFKNLLKDAIDVGRKQTGAGTGGNEGGSGDDDTLDLSAAKNQVDADNLIATHLLKKGLVRHSAAFATEHAKMRKTNNVDKLPVR